MDNHSLGVSMKSQVSREAFAEALVELGHDPSEYSGHRLAIESVSEVYNIDHDILIEAIDRKYLQAQYDYEKDTFWLDALEVAHFYYCIKTEAKFYA
jgi:hypothetical protein